VSLRLEFGPVRRFLALTALLSSAALAQISSSLTLSATPAPSTLGQSVTLTAAVTSGATGKVTFYDGTTLLGTSAISGDQAIFATVLLPSGVRSLHAHYLGDSNYAASNSSVVRQTVTAAVSLGLNPPVPYADGTSPEAIAVGDFNDDGKPDLVVGNEQGSNVVVYLGNGDGTFQAAQPFAVQSWPVAVATGDFNGDGKSDLAVANDLSDSISILLGNGDGTFQPAVTYQLTGQPQSLAVADFNGDGIADLVVGIYENTCVLLGRGDGTFGTPTTVSIMTMPIVAVGDFNGDGKPDLAFTGNGGTVSILLGVGDGTFQTGASILMEQDGIHIVVADFNGDGKADLAVAVAYNDAVAVLIGNGDGTFKAPTYYGDPNGVGSSVGVGDFNGDGIPDLAVGFFSGTGITILNGNGDGTFSTGLFYAANYTPYLLAIGDFNGDGKTDLAGTIATSNGVVFVMLGGAVPDLSIGVSSGAGFTQGQTGASYVISVNNAGQAASIGAVGVVDTLPSGFTAIAISGNGWTCVLGTLACTRSDSLAAGASYPNIVITVNIAAGLTGSATDSATVTGGGDQNPANNTATNTTNVRLSATVSLSSSPNPSTLGQAVTLTASISPSATGRMTFLAGTTILGDAPVASGQGILTSQLLPSGTQSLTVEYSGDPNYGPAISPVHVQTVTETATDGLQSSRTVNPVSPPVWVQIADVNRDNKLDLVVLDVNGSLSIFLGNGDGTFQSEKNFPTTSGSYYGVLAVADFNGDGNPDVAIGSNGGVFVMLGNGDGTFQTAVEYALGNTAQLLAVADFNRDGTADIAVATGAGIQILLGNGNGTFQAPAAVGTAFLSAALLVADFNGDGKPDLLTTSSTNAGQVLLGNGDGTFQSPIAVGAALTNPNAFAVGDFNNDGKIDIAVTYWVGVEVFLGNGDGTFRAPVSTPLTGGSVPGYFAVAGDFNGDGKLDLAIRAYYTDNFAVAFGNGDGTFSGTAVFETDGYASGSGGNIATGDLNGDGRPDFAVPNPESFGTTFPVDIFLGGQFSGLSIVSAHTGYFTAGQTGATYQLTVNNPNYLTTSSAVTVTDTLPAGLTATAVSGTGWSCTLSSLTCTRSDSLGTGISYPAITVTLNVSAGLAPSTLTNHASVSYNGIVNNVTDPTLIVLPSTTTLNVSPGASTLGQPVTMTVTISAGATGKVTFRDGVILLGVAPLVSGQASFTTYLLAAGTRSLLAFYEGDSNHAISSSPSTQFTVSAAAASGFGAASNNPTGSGPSAIAIGDFNLDGIPDLVTANLSNSVSILLGNGNGTFRPYANYGVTGNPVAVAVGDFNGDGKPDLAVADQSQQSMSILLGNGDGTFQAAVSYSATARSRSRWPISTGTESRT
jgi:large repetitive protein